MIFAYTRTVAVCVVCVVRVVRVVCVVCVVRTAYLRMGVTRYTFLIFFK